MPSRRPKPRRSPLDRRLDKLTQLRDEWRARLAPSLSDTAAERDEKEVSLRMKGLGTSPVEFVSGSPDRVEGIVVGSSPAELQALLAAGGHYSGPLPASTPEEPQSPKRKDQR